jgi:hypothetical protein
MKKELNFLYNSVDCKGIFSSQKSWAQCCSTTSKYKKSTQGVKNCKTYFFKEDLNNERVNNLHVNLKSFGLGVFFEIGQPFCCDNPSKNCHV